MSGPTLIKIVSALSHIFTILKILLSCISYSICVHFCDRTNQKLRDFSSTKFALHLTRGKSCFKFNYVFATKIYTNKFICKFVSNVIMQSQTIHIRQSVQNYLSTLQQNWPHLQIQYDKFGFKFATVRICLQTLWKFARLQLGFSKNFSKYFLACEFVQIQSRIEFIYIYIYIYVLFKNRVRVLYHLSAIYNDKAQWRGF